MRNGMLHQNFVLGVVKVSFIKYYLVVQRKTHALYYIVRMCLYFYEKVKKSVLFVSRDCVMLSNVNMFYLNKIEFCQ